MSWRVWSFCLFFAMLFLLLLLPQQANDLYFDLMMGRHILAHGLRSADPYTFAPTHSLSNTPWLSQILIYEIFSRGGFPLLWISKALLGVGSLFFLFLRCRKRGVPFLLSTFITFLAACLLLYFQNMRARSFTFLFFSLFLFLLETQPLSGKWVFFYPLLVLWRNLHGGSILAVISLVIVCGYRLLLYFFPHTPWQRKGDAGPLLLPFLLTFLFFTSDIATPFLRIHLAAPSTGAGEAQLLRQLTEWGGFWFFHPQNIFYLLYLLLTAAAFGLSFPKWWSRDILFCLAFLPLPFFAQRHQPIAVLATAPIGTLWMHEAWKRWGRRLALPPMAAPLATLFGCTLVATYTFLLPFRFIFSTPITSTQAFEESYLPVHAISFIQTNHLPPRLFNDPDWGGYLIFKLYPDYKVSSDGRFLTVYQSRYLREMLHALNARPGWQTFLDRNQIQFALLKKFRPLTQAMEKSQDWFFVYEDPVSVIFLRKGKTNQELINRYFENALSYPEDFPTLKVFADALLRRGDIPRARRFYKQALKIKKASSIYNQLGLSFLMEKKRKRAIAQFQRALDRNSHYLPALVNLSLTYWQMGNREKALDYYLKAKALQGDDPAVKTLGNRLAVATP